jgi:hypothetical protein
MSECVGGKRNAVITAAGIFRIKKRRFSMLRQTAVVCVRTARRLFATGHLHMMLAVMDGIQFSSAEVQRYRRTERNSRHQRKEEYGYRMFHGSKNSNFFFGSQYGIRIFHKNFFATQDRRLL